MKNKIFLIAAVIFLVGCRQSKETKNELNYIAFKVSKDVMIDSLKTATELLDKMDYGNGATCFVTDGKLHHTRKESGFSIVDMPGEISSSVPIIEPLDQENSKRLFNMILFLNNNDITGMVKRYDGLYWFDYKQRAFNPYNNHTEFRDIVYLREPKDTCSKYFNKMVILDRYKNIVLRAPITYNEPKLPMDSASIMKRRDDLIKKEENSNSKTTFSIDEKRFLQQKIDSTIKYHFRPGDSITDDLDSTEREKYILTSDAAHFYKLISIQKKTDNYIGIIVLYVMIGGNSQYFITIDKTGKAISDLPVQSNHADGPLKLENGNILEFKGMSSHFNGDTITVVEKRFLSESRLPGAKKWEENIEKKYLITEDGRFSLLKQ